MQRLETVRRNTGLEEGIPVLEKYLMEIYMNPGIATKELARRCLLPVPVAVAVKKEMLKLDLVTERSGVYLGEQGLELVETGMGFRGIDLSLYKRILTGPLIMDDFLRDSPELSEIFDHRPSVDVTIDQSKSTVETSLKRALLCLRYNLLIGKNVLCLGDDDLVSVAACFVLKKLFPDRKLPVSVTVLDIDDRFTAYIDTLTDKYLLPIKCLKHDLRSGIPSEIKNTMDAVFTDPPYTLLGLKLFLSRAYTALKNRNQGTVFVSYAHRGPLISLDMYKSILELGLVPVEIIPRFNTYEGAGIFGNTSQMIVLLSTGTSGAEPDKQESGLIYTGDIKKTIRFYQCRSCKMKIRVGQEQEYTTIEILKSSGCPQCGAGTFSLLERKRNDGK
ncbi:MAG: bis-aminopropyl spermidine synthase family protein [Spirochaetales bacterium]|nr:bis-aminopropyl spermidine synthase family protein [Spirochaetales bacterium]